MHAPDNFPEPRTKRGWHRSTRCEPNGGNCVEVKFGDDSVAVRDSKHPDGQVLEFDHEEWTVFLASVKDGQFDLPSGPSRPEIP